MTPSCFATPRRQVAGRVGTARGQGLVEYGLIIALTSVLTMIWLFVFGGALSEALAAIGEAIDRATGG